MGGLTFRHNPSKTMQRIARMIRYQRQRQISIEKFKNTFPFSLAC
jgi:hypothetical protein